MRRCSDHFSFEEFERDGELPGDCEAVVILLCENILEPTRQFAGIGLLITSGNRPPAVNAAVHGQPNSEHIYAPTHCAVDFYQSRRPMRQVFDWMRRNPNLPFHQLILEHSSNGSSVIHVSINLDKVGVRSVLEGATHNAEPYVKVDHVEYARLVQPANLPMQGDA